MLTPQIKVWGPCQFLLAPSVFPQGGGSADVVWTQTSSPTEATITGFKAISADAVNAHNYAEGAVCAKFNGLGKSPEGQVDGVVKARHARATWLSWHKPEIVGNFSVDLC